MAASTDKPKLESETDRLEAFSDGVFAVAITLLAFSLTVPIEGDVHRSGGLAHALLNQWTEYVAYTLSFTSILIMWINHHTLFKFIGRTNRQLLLFNGLLLLIITAIPFATNLLAQYIQSPDKKVAQMVYMSLLLFMAITYNRMWAYASRGGRLLDPKADPRLVESITKQYAFGPALYLAGVALDLISAEASLALCIVLAVFFALPSTITHMGSAAQNG